nr:oxoglutarate/iron-dependent dioxygenase [Tanacetum cinerariifolium]
MVPEMCRASLADWDKAVVDLAEELMSILCEGLGIKSDKLKELSCLEGRLCASHYYPHCPQPDLTIGITSHTDPCILTMLVQNEVGDLLQVKCGEEWADVEAMMSNDEYKSVEHRVLANPIEGARVSVAIFFNPSNQEGLYGPFPELISAERPAVYQEFLLADYSRRFYARELDGKALTSFYR